MSATLRLLRAGAIVIIAGCGGSVNSGTDCPSYVVHPEGELTGFSSVGEWRSDEVCAAYCSPDYPVCQLATATSIRCQKGCE